MIHFHFSTFSKHVNVCFPTERYTCTMADARKKTVLVIGGGAVGAVAALNLETGGQVDVTIVLRSNYDAVEQSGYTFESCDHGIVRNWKPTVGASRIPSLHALLEVHSSADYSDSS